MKLTIEKRDRNHGGMVSARGYKISLNGMEIKDITDFTLRMDKGCFPVALLSIIPDEVDICADVMEEIVVSLQKRKDKDEIITLPGSA